MFSILSVLPFFFPIFGCRRRTLCWAPVLVIPTSTAPYECNAVAGVITTMRVPQDWTIRAWLGSFICNVSSSLRIAERCRLSLKLHGYKYNICVSIYKKMVQYCFVWLLRGLFLRISAGRSRIQTIYIPDSKTREEFSFRRPWRQSSLLVSDDCAPLARFNSSKWDLSQCFQGIYENKWRIIDGELERGVENDNSTRRWLKERPWWHNCGFCCNKPDTLPILSFFISLSLSLLLSFAMRLFCFVFFFSFSSDLLHFCIIFCWL